MPSPLARERNRLPLMPVTASASVGRVMCLCRNHQGDDRFRSRGPLEQAYIEASSRGMQSRRRALRQGGQPLTASASGLTTEEDQTYAAWQASLILEYLEADSILASLPPNR